MSGPEKDSACTGKCPCMHKCPLSSALDSIGGKWKIRILCALHQGGKARYNELKRKIEGITNTMLAGSLKELEQDGLVVRIQFMEMPVRVEYSITDACADLIPILGQLAQWGAKARSVANV